MADDYQSEIRVGQPIVPPRKSYSGLFVTLAVVVLVAAAAGFLWMNYDSLVDGFPRSSAPAVGAEDGSELAKEFRAFQQQTSEALAATQQLVDAQQTELKGLTSQIADLTAKIDRMQPGAVALPPTLSAPAAPLAQPAAPRPPQAAAPARATVTAPRKRPAPAASRPEGAISVGGAPLPAPGAPAR